MPEVNVRVRWPDGTRQLVYSPSLVVTDHLAAGTDYPVPDLLARFQIALAEASERVRASYGFPCSRAAASLLTVETAARPWANDSTAIATVESFDR